jgi:acyl carrier protein
VQATLVEHLVGQLAQLLTIPVEEIDPDVPVGLIGLDSLLAARLHVQLAEQLGVFVPVSSLHGRRTLREISCGLEAPAA